MAWLSGWGKRKQIDVQDANVDSGLSNFPLYVKIDNDSDMTGAASDGTDIRFTQSDGTTLLKYERESWSGGGGSNVTADIWVKVPSIASSGGATIYIYWDKSGAAEGEDAANVWSNGFVAVYHLHDDFADSLGNHNGTNQGSADIAGKVANAQDFESSETDYITVADHNDLDGNLTDLTLTAWFKPESFSTLNMIAAKFGGSNNRAYYLGAYNGGSGSDYYLRGTVEDSSANALTVQGTTILSTGTWYFGAWVADPGGNDAGLYLDGVSEGTDTGTLNDICNSTDPFLVGCRDDDSKERFWDGIIDEVRLADAERPVAWLKFEHANINEADNELTWGGAESESAGFAYSQAVWMG